MGIFSDEPEGRLPQIKDKKIAAEVRRFLRNLFLLFDNQPPIHVRNYIAETLDLSEDQKCPSGVSF